MKVELCAFSGKKIYPGHGRLYVRTDNRSFRFVDSKCLSLFLQRKKSSKIHWTIVFRRMHKKGITEEVAKKRSRKTVKVQRSIVGVSLEKITALRNEKPEVRAAAREKAIKDAKAKKEKSKAEKKASGGNNANKISKQQAKGSRPAVAAKSR